MTPRALWTQIRMMKTTHLDEDAKFTPYFPIGEAVATLLHPYAEVVLHDSQSGRIVRIWNAFTRRKAGDPSHLEGAPDLFTDENVLGPYEKSLGSKGRTKSMTAALRDEAGGIIGFFCMNLDISGVDQAIAKLSEFVLPEVKRPEPIYRNDLQEHINYLVRDYLVSANKTIDALVRAERVELVAAISETGLFQARNSTVLVAKALHTSRASVYNLLAEAKSGAAASDRARAASVFPRAGAKPAGHKPRARVKEGE